jgi:hypothetical protein
MLGPILVVQLTYVLIRTEFKINPNRLKPFLKLNIYMKNLGEKKNKTLI